MAERLNCVQNQITTHNKVLIDTKVVSFIITGGQDNIQAVAGGLLTFWSELGFHFPQFPFIAHSRGWDAEDMQNNVRQVRMSEPLRDASPRAARPVAGPLAGARRARGTRQPTTDGESGPQGESSRPCGEEMAP